MEGSDNDRGNKQPGASESLADYFRSPGFLQSYKKVTFSTPEEQEEANRQFSVSLTPLQRLEYHYFLNQAFLSDHFEKLPLNYPGKINFDDPE